MNYIDSNRILLNRFVESLMLPEEVKGPEEERRAGIMLYNSFAYDRKPCYLLRPSRSQKDCIAMDYRYQMFSGGKTLVTFDPETGKVGNPMPGEETKYWMSWEELLEKYGAGMGQLVPANRKTPDLAEAFGCFKPPLDVVKLVLNMSNDYNKIREVMDGLEKKTRDLYLDGVEDGVEEILVECVHELLGY